jgi:hypothetical protein
MPTMSFVTRWTAWREIVTARLATIRRDAADAAGHPAGLADDPEPADAGPPDGSLFPVRSLQDRLAEVDGLDIGRALDRLDGSMIALVPVLESFADTYRSGAPELHIVPADPVRCRTVARRAIDAVATVGATRLETLLQAFDFALDEDRDDVELALQGHFVNRQLCALAADLTDALRALPGESVQPSS